MYQIRYTYFVAISLTSSYAILCDRSIILRSLVTRIAKHITDATSLLRATNLPDTTDSLANRDCITATITNKKGDDFMEYNSTAELLDSDPKARSYFDTLPVDIQQYLLDKCTGAKNADELRAFGDDLRLCI